MLDGIVCVVDAKHFELHIKKENDDIAVENGVTSNTTSSDSNSSRANSNSFKRGFHGDSLEAVQQVCFADKIIINKTDLVSEDELLDILKTISVMNPSAAIVKSVYSRVPVDELLNIRAFDASRNAALLEKVSKTVNVPIFITIKEDGTLAKTKSGSVGALRTKISTVSLVLEDPIDLDKFNFWITQYLAKNGGSVYRVKGKIVNIFYKFRCI